MSFTSGVWRITTYSGKKFGTLQGKTHLLKICLLIKSVYPEFNTGGGRGGGQTIFVLAQKGLDSRGVQMMKCLELKEDDI